MIVTTLEKTKFESGTAAPALSCRQVVSRQHTARQQPILRGVNCQIQAGEFVAIVGCNGAGKSTLLRSLVGLVPLLQGEILIHNQQLTPQTLPHLRRQMSLISQGGGLVGQLSALENVLCGCLGTYPVWRTLWGFPRAEQQRALKLLAMLGLSDQADQSTRQLSGGQQQRVAIARALMQSGEILLADEPTAGLDIHATEQVMQTLLRLQQQGMTVVVVLHDLDLVRRYTQRALVLQAGELVYDGPSEALTADFGPLQEQRL
jgi:phosphonate transport system ATP-binding protein